MTQKQLSSEQEKLILSKQSAAKRKIILHAKLYFYNIINRKILNGKCNSVVSKNNFKYSIASWITQTQKTQILEIDR